MRKLTVCLFALACTFGPVVARTSVQVAAINPVVAEHCQRMENALKDLQRSDQGITDEYAALQGQIDLARSGNVRDIDKIVGQTLAEVRRLRLRIKDEEQLRQMFAQNYSIWWEVWGTGSTAAQATALRPKYEQKIQHWASLEQRDDAELKDAEKRLDYWTQRETESMSGGIVTSTKPPFALSDLKFRQRELLENRVQVQDDIRSLTRTYRAVNCASLAQSTKNTKATGDTWSGTWTFVGVNGGAVILQQTGSIVQGHLNVRGQDYPTFTLKVSGATATGLADVGVGAPGQMTLTIFGKRFTGTLSAAGRSYEPDGYCTAGECLNNR